jgi:hypothetical protein
MQKTFQLSQLRCSYSVLWSRVDALHALAAALPYPLGLGIGRFTQVGDTLLQTMEFLPALPAGPLSAAQVADVALTVQTAHAHGLVHGDLHPKNLRQKQGRAVVVDWEPCLRRVRAGKAAWQYTHPYRHPLDAAADTITELTDRALVLRLSGFPWPIAISSTLPQS